MQLLCIGDVALIDEDLTEWMWIPPGKVVPGDEMRVLFNWELPIGKTINPIPRSSGSRLLANPDSPRVIRRWSPGFATLANNHILDAGEEGLTNTIELLNQSGFMTVGAGRTREQITKPLFWETTEGQLAIINWVFPETHPDWLSVPGPNCWPGFEEAKRIIQELKRKTDWVLVVVHWSDELFAYPRPEDRHIARELSQMGADLIVGHHPHVVRGMEVIGSCPVFYSIGNFYFSDMQAPRNLEGLGVKILFRRGKRPEYQTLSFFQKKRCVILDPFNRAVRRINRVSRPLRRIQSSMYNEWHRVKYDHFCKWGAKWHFGFRRLGLRGTIIKLLRQSYIYFCSSLKN